MCCKHKSKFIKKSFSKDEVYSVYLHQIEVIEKTIITLGDKDQNLAFEASMDIGFKLFPIIDSISLNILGRRNGREYLKEMGFSGTESEMIYSMFRNGIMHTINPYEFKFRDGTVSWGLMSSGGSGGFTPFSPGYTNKTNPELNTPADKAFILEKMSDSSFHASLSLDRLVAQIRFDLKERQKNDKRRKIDVVIGQEVDDKIRFSN